MDFFSQLLCIHLAREIALDLIVFDRPNSQDCLVVLALAKHVLTFSFQNFT